MAILKDLNVQQFVKDLLTEGKMKRQDSPTSGKVEETHFIKAANGVDSIYLVDVTYNLPSIIENNRGKVDTKLVDISIVEIVQSAKLFKRIENVKTDFKANNLKEFYKELASSMQIGFNRIREMKGTPRKNDPKSDASARQKKYIYNMVGAINQFGVIKESLTSKEIQKLSREEADKLIQKLLPAYNAVYVQYKESLRKNK